MLTAIQKAYGNDFFAAVKTPVNSFQYISGKAKVHAMDNGSGIMVTREFCDNCGSNIIEYSVSRINDIYKLFACVESPADYIATAGECTRYTSLRYHRFAR